MNSSNSNYYQSYIDNKIKQKNIFANIILNSKILIIIACHTTTLLKYKTLERYIECINEYAKRFPSIYIDIVVINSKSLPLSQQIVNKLIKNKYRYFEISNNNMLDFGKWAYVLEHIDITLYDFITFTNDSFFIANSIHHFFNLMIYKNLELYAYTSSSEHKYHYQSYLFGLNRKGISKFKDFFTKNNSVDGYYLEMQLYDYYQTKDCFLDIGKLNINNNKNIFFHNNSFYLKLLQSSLLPIIKIKKINSPSNSNNKQLLQRIILA